MNKEGYVKNGGMGVKKIVNHKMMDPGDIQRLIDDAWLGLDIREEEIFNPIKDIPEFFHEEPHLFLTWVMSRPEYISLFCKEVMNVTIFPLQALMLYELWHHKFPILLGSRGLSKTYTIALYAMLRAIFLPGRKVCVVGSAFRQAKLVFEYCEVMWRNAPLLRDMIGQGKRDDQVIQHDSSMWSFKIGESRIMALPLGDGTTIRGLRSNDTIAEEFASINRSVFENVVAGFGVVSQDPVENMKFQSRKAMKKKLGVKDEEVQDESRLANQIILCGTAYYRFNHFYTYFEKYRSIIRSCGDMHRLEKVVGDEAHNPDFRWQDYCVIRIPYDLVSAGYFDNAQISRSKVNTLASNFLAEYYACFPADSDGFFKRSLIEKATPSNSNKIELGGKIIDFVPKIVGNPMSRYVIAIDPASEEDNCALIILELMDDHRRVVYSWTTNKKLHRRNLTIKKTDESNYWAFVVRKIRNLMNRFPTVAIVIDSQGGGNTIREGLSDKDKLQNNEQQIWPIINQQKQEYSDTQEGLHIIHMFHFASNELLSNAYFNTKKDLDTQQLVFPSFDGATLGLVECETDDTSVPDGGLEDTLEGIVEEIEELKNELTCIMHTKLPSGRDQFSVPDIKTADGKKARVKKDRASALIMANSTSRAIMRDHIDTTYESNGGYATPQKQENGLLYSNVWYGKAMQDAYADL